MSGGHTPGPWSVESNGFYPVVRKRFRADHHMDVCGPVHGYMYSADEKAEQAANARLIAAAPELLTSLSEMVEVYTQLVNCGDCGTWDPELEGQVIRARAAIAKATGAA